MARHESDREDLLREATALVERVELEVTSFDQPIVVGFRRNGCGSIYFGADPVVQFNADGAVRRGYRNGRLLKAEHGQLVELQRQRTAEATVLERRELTADEQRVVLDEFARAIARLKSALCLGSSRTIGQVPAEADVVSRVRGWLDQLPSVLCVANSPGAGSAR